MPRTTLLRTLSFRAEHRYWRSDWSEDRNRQVFGEQALPHTHDWKVEVALDGAVDRETGFLVDLEALDALLREVVGTLDGQDLNEAIPEVRKGEILPSTEELAGWLWSQLEGRVPGSARLRRVRLAESPCLASEVVREEER
jgi:6-pyruvoyltetrahydropterin/6-carboxytetrahydropterin synthase